VGKKSQMFQGVSGNNLGNDSLVLETFFVFDRLKAFYYHKNLHIICLMAKHFGDVSCVYLAFPRLSMSET
jgi:hypothetical protein